MKYLLLILMLLPTSIKAAPVESEPAVIIREFTPVTSIFMLMAISTALRNQAAVTLIIDSRGGVYEPSSEAILDLVATNSPRVTCIVHGQASSLAASLLTRCGTRLATPGSRILWHGIRSIGMMTIDQFRAKAIYEQFVIDDLYLWAPLYHIYKGREDWVLKHMQAETMHRAEDLPDLVTIIPEGVMNAK